MIRDVWATYDSVFCHTSHNRWQCFMSHCLAGLLFCQYWLIVKKAKFSHTHYRPLGPELIPVYRQSACRWLFKLSPFGRLPSLPSPSQPKNITVLRLVVPSYTAWCQKAHRCEQLAQGCYAALFGWELNPPPIDRKSNALPLGHWFLLIITN